MKKKTNQKHLFFAADTEAQPVFNDEKLSYYINVTLKTRRGQLQHQLQYNPSSQVRNELIRVNNEIEAKSKELCNVMNTYLIGYAPISTKKSDDQKTRCLGVEKCQILVLPRSR